MTSPRGKLLTAGQIVCQGTDGHCESYQQSEVCQLWSKIFNLGVSTVAVSWLVLKNLLHGILRRDACESASWRVRGPGRKRRTIQELSRSQLVKRAPEKLVEGSN
ncbi:hypothetical protein FA95DRAFT_535514 [Auriscalpium vulgare]|uniref:Uncharacterized protein n=1 Tax=Auriscalpium vulgare TaxID=40419 RepID=A0ACB8RFQ3_9AGAM|nr:hypothetical protein FA95DRAFT_535514 [Auriscalpium vulgare]